MTPLHLGMTNSYNGAMFMIGLFSFMVLTPVLLLTGLLTPIMLGLMPTYGLFLSSALLVMGLFAVSLLIGMLYVSYMVRSGRYPYP